MLAIARRKADASLASRFVQGDMMALPFPAASFDVVTTGYGIRNVPRIEPAIDEIARVLRPGGVFLSLDFDRPANALDSRRLSRLPARRRRRARLGPAPRSRHLSLHSRVDSRATRAPPACRRCSGAPAFTTPAWSRAGRTHGDQPAPPLSARRLDSQSQAPTPTRLLGIVGTLGVTLGVGRWALWS